MTTPLSDDLRSRVVVASSVVKWTQRYRSSGSVAPGQMGRHRKRILELLRAFVVEQINQTLHGLKARLVARGVQVSHDTVWQFLRREGFRFKKHCSPLSRPVLISSVGASAGAPSRASLTRADWFLSTKP